MGSVDLIIVGAGPTGCVIAERAARLNGWSSLIVERRSHIGGNCYDRFHENGTLVHQYGPHYFRTNNVSLIDYLSQFTEWIEGNYVVMSQVGGKLFPFPINLTTLENYFGRAFTEEEALTFLEEKREKIPNPKNSEEFCLSRVGHELYQAFYLGYTLKQWGRHPRDLAPTVCGRIPIRVNRNNRYVDHLFQLTPAKGFTALFDKMISHPNIKVELGSDYRQLRTDLKPRVATVYAGPIDEYFGFRFGKLPWRSLEFDFRAFPKTYIQPCVQINYPNDHEYTRSVEIKHVTGQSHSQTVVAYEYSKEQGEPYYPVPSDTGHQLYEKYYELAQTEQRERGVYFAGRLARYAYINTDEAIESALNLFETILSDFRARKEKP